MLDSNECVDAADVPQAIWIHYEYVHAVHTHTATQRIRLDLPHFKCERLAHITNHIFAKGYLPSNTRSLVSWKGACGKHIEESTKVEDVLTWGEGHCEGKPLRLVIGEFPSKSNCAIHSLVHANGDVQTCRELATCVVVVKDK